MYNAIARGAIAREFCFEDQLYGFIVGYEKTFKKDSGLMESGSLGGSNWRIYIVD